MKKKGIQKSLRVLCMLLCFFAMTAVRVSAAEAHGQGQKGSLSVVMQNRKTNTKIPGGEVALYQVAEITSKETESQYEFTNGFENCGLKLDNLEDELLAEKLKAEIGASTVGVAQTIGADGTAGFSGLEEGIYLDGNKIILKDGAKEIEVVNTADLKLLGKHNFENVMAAVAMAYYDGVVCVDLSAVRPMIAMPFHPSNAYTIDELNANLDDILADVEKRAAVSLGNKVPFTLRDKVRDGKMYVDQGVIAGCAGGGFENLCDVADMLDGQSIGDGRFSLSVYPASQPVYMELIRNGSIAKIMETGATVRTAFCGPCFGAGDVPANNAFSIRHSTRNFPNREGSKVNNGQIASVALMDARSIAATALNKGRLTAATDIDVNFTKPKYYFDSHIYEKRVYNGVGKADPSVEIQFGPNIKDWPSMVPLTDNILLKVVSEIHDPVTTTDELIPSGETSSFRSNPLGLAEFTLSRKDPEYVGRAKKVRAAEEAREDGKCP